MKLLLNRMYDTQRALDDRILEKFGLNKGFDITLFIKRLTAFVVEAGETMNEYRGFKFWSKDQEPRTRKICDGCHGEGQDENEETCFFCDGSGGFANKNPLLEEYVDGFHFILSIGIAINQVEIIPNFPGPNYKDTLTPEVLFLTAVQAACMMTEDNYYEELLQAYLDLGYAFGFTWEQIEEAYFAKNKVNHERQDNNY